MKEGQAKSGGEDRKGEFWGVQETLLSGVRV